MVKCISVDEVSMLDKYMSQIVEINELQKQILKITSDQQKICKKLGFDPK